MQINLTLTLECATAALGLWESRKRLEGLALVQSIDNAGLTLDTGFPQRPVFLFPPVLGLTLPVFSAALAN